MSADTEYDWLTLTDGEAVVWSGQPRRRSVLKVVFVVAALVVAAGVVDPMYGLATLPLGALLIGWLYLRIVNTDYVLTDRSVYRRTGVLGETVSRASVAKVQNVDFSKGVVGNQFGFGTVEVSTAGGGDVRIANVHDPEEPKEVLDEHAKRTEGVGMDASGAGGGHDPAAVARLEEEAEALREVAESLEETFTGGGA